MLFNIHADHSYNTCNIVVEVCVSALLLIKTEIGSSKTTNMKSFEIGAGRKRTKSVCIFSVSGSQSWRGTRLSIFCYSPGDRGRNYDGADD